MSIREKVYIYKTQIYTFNELWGGVPTDSVDSSIQLLIFRCCGGFYILAYKNIYKYISNYNIISLSLIRKLYVCIVMCMRGDRFRI